MKPPLLPPLVLSLAALPSVVTIAAAPINTVRAMLLNTAGMTLCDGRHLGPDLQPLKHRGRGQPPNAEVAIAVNVERFWELFLDILATYP